VEDTAIGLAGAEVQASATKKDPPLPRCVYPNGETLALLPPSIRVGTAPTVCIPAKPDHMLHSTIAGSHGAVHT